MKSQKKKSLQSHFAHTKFRAFQFYQYKGLNITKEGFNQQRQIILIQNPNNKFKTFLKSFKLNFKNQIMLNPLDHIKSFDQKLHDKRLMHSQKLLKSRIRSFLPTEVAINQFSESNKETHLLKLYSFELIPKKQYERILSNPLYFFQTERNFKMFEYFLMKNGYYNGRNMFYQKRKGSEAIGNEERVYQFQFKDDSKINYKEPWSYIRDIVTKMSNQSTINQNNYRTLRAKPLQFTKSRSITLSQKPVEKISKSQHKLTLKLRQQSTKLCQQKQYISSIQQINLDRAHHFNRLLQADNRMRLLKLRRSEQIRQKRQSLLEKTEQYQLKRYQSEKIFSEMTEFNQKLRERCIKTLKDKPKNQLMRQDSSENALLSVKLNTFTNKRITSSERRKQRKVKNNQAFKVYLQKRLGIEDNTLTPSLNPQKKE